MSADRQMRNDRFGGAARGEIAVAVGKAQHGIGIADIDPLRIGSGRIEGDAERIVKPRRKDRRLCRLAAIGPQHADAPGAAFRDEDVAVGSGARCTRTGETRSEQVHFEAGRNGRLLIAPMHHSDEVVGGR